MNTSPDPLDDHLGDVLRRHAETVHAEADWDDVERRATRTPSPVRARLRWVPVAAAVAAIALIGATLLGDGGDAELTTRPAPTTQEDAPTSTTGVTTTVVDPPAADAFAGSYEWYQFLDGDPGSDQQLLHLVDTEVRPDGTLRGDLRSMGFQTDVHVAIVGRWTSDGVEFAIDPSRPLGESPAYDDDTVLFRLSGNPDRPVTELVDLHTLVLNPPPTGTYFVRPGSDPGAESPGDAATEDGAVAVDGPPNTTIGLPAAVDPLPADQAVVALVRSADDEPGAIDLVVVSLDDGTELATIADGFDLSEGGVFDLTLSPDRRTVLYVVATSACTSEVWASPIDGSTDPIVVTDRANAVAISPSGDRIAVDRGDLCFGARSVDVLQVEGGGSQRFPLVTVDDGLDDGVESLAFLDDTTILALRRPEGTTLHRLDTAAGTITTSTVEPLRGLSRSAIGEVTAIAGTRTDPVVVRLDAAGPTGESYRPSFEAVVEARRLADGRLLLVHGDEAGALSIDDRALIPSGVRSAVT